MFKSIVVPVDGSAYADKAISTASEFAANNKAELTLVHVMHRHGSARVPPGFKEYAKLEHLEVTEQDFFQALSDSGFESGRAESPGAGHRTLG